MIEEAFLKARIATRFPIVAVVYMSLFGISLFGSEHVQVATRERHLK